jgi:hypothetical protein
MFAAGGPGGYYGGAAAQSYYPVGSPPFYGGGGGGYPYQQQGYAPAAYPQWQQPGPGAGYAPPQSAPIPMQAPYGFMPYEGTVLLYRLVSLSPLI